MVSTKQSRSSKRSSSEMFPLIQQWELSELSQKEFCTRHGIKPHIFWYWQRRYRQRDQQVNKAAKGFIPVEVESSSEGSVMAEIIYRDGTRLVFKERVGLKLLQALLPKV